MEARNETNDDVERCSAPMPCASSGPATAVAAMIALSGLVAALIVLVVVLVIVALVVWFLRKRRAGGVLIAPSARSSGKQRSRR
jgi:Flp pilus assembly protein TadB